MCPTSVTVKTGFTDMGHGHEIKEGGDVTSLEGGEREEPLFYLSYLNIFQEVNDEN
jgi:hypothetical protein